MWFEPGPGTRTCKSASCTDFPSGYDLLAALAAERGGVWEGWGLPWLPRGIGCWARRGPVVVFNSDLKEICPSPLAPGGLGGDAASRISVGLRVGLVGSSGGIWGTEPPGHLRQKYKKWGMCIASLPLPCRWGTGGGLGKVCSLACSGPTPGVHWGRLCWASASVHA